MADFLVNGVLKVVYIPIYVPAYLVFASGLYHYLALSRWKQSALSSSVIFLAGTALGHLTMTGRHELRTYEMDLVRDTPISLHSSDFSQTLTVTSDKLRTELARSGIRSGIPVTIQVIKDYSCIRFFEVSTVADVDVMMDSKADWVWRQEGPLAADSRGLSGMDEENRRLPWCRIRWF